MAITLNWSNRNQAVTAVKIYRGLSRQTALTLLDTLGAVETYTDAAVVPNKLYYYQIALVINGEEVPGALLPMSTITDMGPGPQTLMTGTMEYGYFGKMSPADLFTSTQLQTLVGSMSNVTNYGVALAYWRKFAHFGKIIYIPDVPIWTSNSATILNMLNGFYLAGALYGHGTTAKMSTITAAATVQNKRIVKDQYELIVRLPKANVYTEASTTYATTTNSLDYCAGEMLLVVSNISNGFLSRDLITNGLAFPRIGQTEATPAAVIIYSQHLANANTGITAQTNIGTSTSTQGLSATGGYALPVLELAFN